MENTRLQDLQAQYREKMKRLREIREMRGAELTDEIRAERRKLLDDVHDLITDIDTCRASAGESSYHGPPAGCGGGVPEFNAGGAHQPDGQRDRNPGQGYEVRAYDQPKTFRHLFGQDPLNRYSWEDRETGFWSALFSGRSHPALQTRAMVEGTPSDGGFLVPVEYSEMIHNVALESEVVMPRCSVVPMSTNEKRLPAMSIGDHSSNLFGGFVAYYKAEEATLTEADPKTREMTLHAQKLTGFLKMSNELVNDLPRGENQIVDICGAGLGWYRDKAFLKGTGVGEPLGILNSPCLITVSKETGQAATTLVYENLVNMLAQLHPASFARSLWVAHPTTIPQLTTLTIDVGTAGTHIPVMKESNGAFSILTRPVVFSEKMEPLGTAGDIGLFDFSQYVAGLREEMRIDLSKHVYFTTDHLAARLIQRHDGQPLWDEALTLEDGSTTVSPFLVLETRS